MELGSEISELEIQIWVSEIAKLGIDIWKLGSWNWDMKIEVKA